LDQQLYTAVGFLFLNPQIDKQVHERRQILVIYWNVKKIF